MNFLSLSLLAVGAVSSACPGHKIGTFTWSQAYWKGGDSRLLDWLSGPMGQEWACGDLSINVADYSCAGPIDHGDLLIAFIQEYRRRIPTPDTIVWLTYGDVTTRDPEPMMEFTHSFFAWASAIPEAVAATMGTIGISYDVEHINPEATKEVLTTAQELSLRSNFERKIQIQHTIEGRKNPIGTDYVMKLADSALIMAYRNYVIDPTGRYHPDSNLPARVMYMLRDQCVNCLNDEYAIANYKAKITIMVEASCGIEEYCGKISFCAHDKEDQGAHYLVKTISETDRILSENGSITDEQRARLFSSTTPWSIHDWEWYNCFSPFHLGGIQMDQCRQYHRLAKQCRGQ